MLQTHRKLAAFALVALVGARATAEDGSGSGSGSVVVNVGGTRTGKYPIALPAAVDGDSAAEIAKIETFDLQLAGVFKVLDPQGFLADLKGEGLDKIDPQKWKDVGAYGVVKFRATGSDVTFKFYQVDKADQPFVKTYPRRGDLRHIVHTWCNDLYKFLTHEDGFFGSKIAFTQKGKGQSAIIAMDFDGYGAYSVSHNSSTNILPAWSPNGAFIAYTSFMRSNPDLYVGPSGGGRPKKVSAQPGMNTGASFSPDGSKIALTLSKDGNPEIYIINANDGSIIKRITTNKAIDTSPSWSPDGGQLAFVSDRNGGPQIFVVSAGGGNPTQVSTVGSYNTTPQWSPAKGKHVLAYTTRDGGNYDIVTLDLDSKAMTRITQNEGQNEEPSFSPNGRAIAFARLGQGVYIAPADGTGKATKVWSGSATGVRWGPSQ